MKRLAWIAFMAVGVFAFSYTPTEAFGFACDQDNCTRDFQCQSDCNTCTGDFLNPGECTVEY